MNNECTKQSSGSIVARRKQPSYNNNNNNNTWDWDNVYGAVIMTQVISRVRPVHLTNAG